jgi:hypothetical protein
MAAIIIISIRAMMMVSLNLSFTAYTPPKHDITLACMRMKMSGTLSVLILPQLAEMILKFVRLSSRKNKLIVSPPGVTHAGKLFILELWNFPGRQINSIFHMQAL